MKTSDLIGPQLDYWVARAEGVAAADLELRGPAGHAICVRHLRIVGTLGALEVLDYSTNWALAGSLADKYDVFVEASNYPSKGPVFAYRGWHDPDTTEGEWGATRMVAVCRAVVRSAFGDEVEDLPC